MFTGLIEEVGTVRQREDAHGAARLRIGTTLPGLHEGDSVAVAGVCLTVAALERDGFTADVMPETLARTTLGALETGARVNLERALAAGGRFGGHLVQGHVDGVGVVRRRVQGPRWVELTIAAPAPLMRYVAPQGSITVAGVSLTVTAVAEQEFGVALIPTTLEETTLSGLEVDSRVNLEVDVLAKYVERLLPAASRGAST